MADAALPAPEHTRMQRILDELEKSIIAEAEFFARYAERWAG